MKDLWTRTSNAAKDRLRDLKVKLQFQFFKKGKNLTKCPSLISTENVILHKNINYCAIGQNTTLLCNSSKYTYLLLNFLFIKVRVKAKSCIHNRFTVVIKFRVKIL